MLVRYLVPSILGLACLRLWLQICLYNSYTVSDGGMVSIVSNLFYALVLLLGTAWFGYRYKERETSLARNSQTVPWIALALMTASAFSLFLANAMGIGGTALVVIAAFAGISAPFGGATWVLIYRDFDTRDLLTSSMLALGIGSLAGFVVGFLPELTRILIGVLMPACSFLLYRRAGANHRDRLAQHSGHSETARWFDSEPFLTVVVLLSGVALESFALGVSRGLPVGGPIEMGLGLRALHQLGVVVIAGAIAYLVGFKGAHVGAPLLWGVALGIIALSLILESVFVMEGSGLPVAFANLGDTLSLGIIWLLAIDYARHASVHEFTVVGLAWFTRIFARNLGRVVAPAFAGSAVMVNLIVGIVVIAVAAASAILLAGMVPQGHRLIEDESYRPESGNRDELGSESTRRNDRAAESTHNGEAASSDIIAVRTKTLQSTFGLTEREAQVCALIASGRNKTGIADYLMLSENTVRTHSKNAYAKLGIHTKEELIVLLEGDPGGQ